MVFIKCYFGSCLALSIGNIGIFISVNILSHSVDVQNARLLKGHNSSHQYQRMIELYELSMEILNLGIVCYTK